MMLKRQHTQDSDLFLDPRSPKTTNTRPKNETSQSQADSTVDPYVKKPY